MAKNGKLSPEMMKANLGLDKDARDGICNILRAALSDQEVLRTKTQSYHWNVTGPQFHSLHEIFESQYNELGIVIDETAEFLRSYGVASIGTLAEFLQYARLKEEPGVVPPARGMVENLLSDHEAVIRSLREDVEMTTEKYNDVASADYLTGLIEKHMKTAWMLRALIEGESI